MGMNRYVSGTGIVNDDVRNNHEAALRAAGQNLIQQLQDGAVTLTADGGIFAEAYVDADGQANSVDTGSTDATFDTDKYYADGTGDDIIYHTIPSGTFKSTLSSGFLTFKSEDWESGADVQYKLRAFSDDTNINDTTIYSNGSNAWVTLNTYNRVNSTTPEVTNESRNNTAGRGFKVRVTFDYLDGTSEEVIETSSSSSYVTLTHTNPNPSKPIDRISIAHQADGNDDTIVTKDIAATMTGVYSTDENSGFLASNEIVSFSAFSNEPNQLQVKLIPKTTSPTSNFPSINGVALYADKPA